MNQDDVKTKLATLKHSLLGENSINSKSLDQISELCGYEIPLPIQALLVNSSKYSEGYCEGWLSGYENELMTPDRLLDLYTTKKSDSMLYFGVYETDSNFNFVDHNVDIWYGNPDADSASPEVVTNLLRYLPIASLQGDYIVVDLDSKGSNPLFQLDLISGYLYATNIIEHLDFLINGLGSGEVTIDEDSGLEITHHPWERT